VFGREDWDEVARRYEAWWAREGPLFLVTARKKDAPPVLDLSHVDPTEKRVNPEHVIARTEDALEHTYYGGDAFAHIFVNLGPGILAGYLGCQVHMDERTVWFEKCIHSWEGQRFELNPGNAWWQKTLLLTEALCEASRGRFHVSVTDLGGSYDILASLRGTQEILFDFADAPDALARAAAEVTDAWLECHEALYALTTKHQPGSSVWFPIWSPGRMYVPQSDISAMLSPEDFRRHDVPQLRRICDAMDHIVYHLDGPDAIKHVDALLEIPELDAIQWVPGAGAKPMREWVPLLARIQDGGKGVCCCGVKPEDVEPLARALRPEGLYISCRARDESEARALEKQATTWLAR